MSIYLFSDFCAPGNFEHGFACYATLDTVFRSQAEGATLCASMGAQLASIETVEELQLIQRLLRDTCKNIRILSLQDALNELSIISQYKYIYHIYFDIFD